MSMFEKIRDYFEDLDSDLVPAMDKIIGDSKLTAMGKVVAIYRTALTLAANREDQTQSQIMMAILNPSQLDLPIKVL